MRRGAGALLAALLLAPFVLEAQDGGSAPRPAPRLTITLTRDSAGGLLPPVVRATNLMADGTFEGSLRNGFPVSFGFHLALWRDGALFDRLEQEYRWEAVVVLDPVSNSYQLIRPVLGTIESFADLASLDSTLSTPFTVDAVPRRRTGRYYYTVDLDAESLSLSELEEIERWLRGDLGRALTERGDVGNAFSRGARLVMIRLSGLPRRTLQTQTAKFQP